MDGDSHLLRMPDRLAEDRVAVIDIGSNSVRLVVYEGRGRAIQIIFNEKTACGLGADITEDGRLSERGMNCAIAALQRFERIARGLEVSVLDAFATAAAREAENGDEFIDRIRTVCGIEVEVLSGEEEGRISAEGVLASIPEADGAMGDLGGGSLELVSLDQGGVGHCDTMPIGILRLAARHGDDLAAIRKAVRKTVRDIDWLPRVAGRSFVAVGGAWRALARLYMNVSGAPVHIVQGLAVPSTELQSFLGKLAKEGVRSEEDVRGLSRRRIEMLPTAAVLLSTVIERARPAQVQFSAYGVREGRLMSHLSAAERLRDPLLAACADLSADTPRFRISSDEVFHWMSPLFAGESAAHQRMRRAACIVGDIGWRDHPDYRPEQVFRRLLTMPAVGIDHPGRAYLATAVYARYTQHLDAPGLAPARTLLSEAEFRDATVAGGALRLAYEMSGGDRDIFGQTRLERTVDEIILHVADAVAPLIGNAVDRRLGQVAKRAGVKAQMRVSTAAASAA